MAGRFVAGRFVAGHFVDRTFLDFSGPDKSLTGRFVGLTMKILPPMPYLLR